MKEKRFKAQLTFHIMIKDMAPADRDVFIAERADSEPENIAAATEHWERDRRLLHAVLKDEKVLRRLVEYSLFGMLQSGDYLRDERVAKLYAGDEYVEVLKPAVDALPAADIEAFDGYARHQLFTSSVEGTLDAVTVELSALAIDDED